MLLAGSAGAVHGQSALDGFDPNANGAILAVVVQPDGKILIGGDFTSLSPNGGAAVTRNYIARLNPDGTLDTNFNPNASGEVAAIAVQADGKVLAGGSFTSIGGQTRFFLARLNATNGLADSFNPNPNSDVASIAVQTNGMILVGGDFNQGNGTPTIGGATRNDIARLDPTTGLADSFNPNAGSTVYAITVQADGKILAGGDFSSIGGQTRYHIARLDGTTGLADSFAPDANGDVYAIAIQADGKVLAGGNFASIGGQSRNHIARLDATTGLADSLNPNANQQVNAIAVQADGKILAGGNFSGTGSIGGQTRGRIARLDPNTGLADSFDPGANGPVQAIAVQQDGKVLAGGSFTSLSPDGGTAGSRNRMVRLETDGRLDQTFSSSFDSFVYATAIQPDGKTLFAGDFSSVSPNGGAAVTRNGIVRLNADGTIDTNFNPNANDDVYAIVVQPDGKILAGGNFTSIGGQARNGIARLDATTGLADSFNPSAGNYVDDNVLALALQPDGKVLIGGKFTTLSPNGGLTVTRNRIARVNSDGTLDTGFNPNASTNVYAIAVQTDGKILAGGTFTNIGGQARNYIARLDATSGLADSFDPNANGSLRAIVVQTDGKILVGGNFGIIGGQLRSGIGRLDATTGLADSFNPTANGAVYSIAPQANGKILIGGYFSIVGNFHGGAIVRLNTDGTPDPAFYANANFDVIAITLQADGKIFASGDFNTIGGQGRFSYARLSDDTAAQRNLVATPSVITWTLGGSSPQFTRVTFEISTDETNYNALGNGTATGSNWTLAGLSLPTGQNIYVRARGFYGSGFDNGSGSITESVRNVFLAATPRLNIQRSMNTNVVLSWSTNFTGFMLQSNANFNSNSWGTVSPPPAVSGTNNVVTNTISGPARFYRLSQ